MNVPKVFNGRHRSRFIFQCTLEVYVQIFSERERNVRVLVYCNPLELPTVPKQSQEENSFSAIFLRMASSYSLKQAVWYLLCMSYTDIYIAQDSWWKGVIKNVVKLRWREALAISGFPDGRTRMKRDERYTGENTSFDSVPSGKSIRSQHVRIAENHFRKSMSARGLYIPESGPVIFLIYNWHISVKIKAASFIRCPEYSKRKCVVYS